MVVVAVLGFAGSGALAQGVTFSGSADMGVKYAGTKKDESGTLTHETRVTWVSNFDIAMSATGTTDGGLTFGASATVKAGNASSEVGKSNAYIGGESWKIAIGDLDPASHMGRSIGDVGYDGLGVDDVAEKVGGYEGTDADVEVSFSLGTASLKVTAGHDSPMEDVPISSGGSDLELPAAHKESKADNDAKQDTQWAAGVSFDIGSTSLSIGMDSEKLMQAGVSADLGAFGGKLFFSQQKVNGPSDTDITDDNDGPLTNKKTGIGVEISVSAGTNTTINAVYAQGKQSDIRPGYDSTASESDDDHSSMVEAQTDKGFGVGVTHDLGGGATLAAGFGKVKKQTMASVGVSMSF